MDDGLNALLIKLFLFSKSTMRWMVESIPR